MARENENKKSGKTENSTEMEIQTKRKPKLVGKLQLQDRVQVRYFHRRTICKKFFSTLHTPPTIQNRITFGTVNKFNTSSCQSLSVQPFAHSTIPLTPRGFLRQIRPNANMDNPSSDGSTWLI